MSSTTDAVLFHLIPTASWEYSRANKTTYFPGTYQQDGFTHLTADPQLLLSVANQFYKDSEGEWQLLVLNAAKLHATVKYEPAAPVGSKPAAEVKKGESPQIFPHLYGGINVDAVEKVLPMRREDNGIFVEIEGI